MKKLVSILIGVLSPVLGAAATKLYLARRARREAEEARPKIEALLDEMISIVSSHRGRLDEVVMRNETNTTNDETCGRDVAVHSGGQHLALDLTTKLIGPKTGHVCIRIYRQRGDQILHVWWPGIVGYRPMEAWLKERLDRIDALVGDVSRRSRVDMLLSRLGAKDDDDVPPSTN